MTKLEFVYKGLEHCSQFKGKCTDCPYGDGMNIEKCTRSLCMDALSVLKELDKFVHCKDCKWAVPKKDGFGNDEVFCYRYQQPHKKPDWFCAAGEKKCESV